uniref:Uncharacterized protein n=1 Tax=Sphaerodactylus townsendi TaxID=933632 RepID=A0ACB8G8X6_9SAUR
MKNDNLPVKTVKFPFQRSLILTKNINKCTVIWIVSDIERVLGEKTQDQLLEESIKAFPGGMCTDIALVVSKSDKINLDEYRRERKNKNIKNEHDAILERNQDVKNKKEKSIMQKLKRKLPPDAEVLNKPKLVYTVCAQEFWKESPLKILSQEETEIPELRDYVKMIYLKEKQKLVKDYVTEAWGILRLAKNAGTNSQPEDLVFRKIVVEELIKKEIDSLEKALQKCSDEILQPLCRGVEQAKRRYKKTVLQMLTRVDGYRGYHKTLKAVFLKDGIYASKKFARIDFNESLAKPLYDEIDSIFGGIFRTQHTTRSSLWSHLKIFKNEVKKKILKTGKVNSLPSDNSKICMFIQEVDAILEELEKWIIQKKILIYQSLSKSIQSDLKPHYKVYHLVSKNGQPGDWEIDFPNGTKEMTTHCLNALHRLMIAASSLRGTGSCEGMKRIIIEGTDNKVKELLFERATSKMESQFHELKEYILQELKKKISTLFSLVFLQQDWVPVHLAGRCPVADVSPKNNRKRHGAHPFMPLPRSTAAETGTRLIARMVTDVQLAIFANMLGVSLFLLVVLYHYVAVNNPKKQE